MRVLVLGQGGREHAIVRSLRFSPVVSDIFAVPGSDGMAQEAHCRAISYSSPEFTSFLKDENIGLVVVGPEQPLADGVVSTIKRAGIPVFGPDKRSAQLESSKVFAKEFMKAAQVPTAAFEVVSSVEQTMGAAQNFTPPYVLKADGLAAGKGVVICKTLEELQAAAQEFFVDKVLGDAAQRALLEQFQEGWELSCLILTNGKSYRVLPPAQDHKRLFDWDEGPNTGGMGAIAPIEVDFTLMSRIEREILQPVVARLEKEAFHYRGILYVGLMITKDGPKVIEFNCRFGDPEAQVILPLLNGDWGQVFLEVANGDIPDLKWKSIHTACVVMAAPGYPQKPERGVRIEGDVFAETHSSYFLHAGTRREGNQWVTSGGRVLNAVGIGNSRKEALDRAYNQAAHVKWQGQQMRFDIGNSKTK